MNERRLSIMIKSMMHEPFYNSGTYINDQLGLYVGWICHKDSFTDCMPVLNEQKDMVLIFSGENFPDHDIAGHLKGQGHEFDPSDASCLIHLYEEKGIAFLQDLNGWFSGMLIDLREKKAVLFNDRYGMHRVFYHEGKNGNFFSSEAKALLAVLPEVREFDPKGLGEFLTCGCTLGNRSLYKGVDILPPGSLWISEHGKMKKWSTYFDLKEWGNQQVINEKQFSHNLVESFSDLVKKYLGGVLPVGISLTGGLDSRMVMACLETRTDEFPCYTFGSMYRDTFDVKVGREVAKACNQPHKVLVLGEEFLNELPYYLEKAVYISDGYVGLSGAAELYANSLARNIAPVRLTGNYGGELLRGDRAFKSYFPKGGFVSLDLKPYLLEAQTTFQELEHTDAVTFALFHQAPMQGYGRLAIEKSQVILRTPFMDNELVKLVYQAPPHLLKGEELSVAIISRYNPNLLKIPTDRGLLCNGSLIRRLARQFYREALFRAEYWSSHGMPAWFSAISRYGLGRFFEKSFLGSHKFQHFRLWTQKQFAGYITDVLIQGSRGLGEFFNLCQVESMVNEHISGKKNYIDEIDKLLTLTLAHNNLLKGGAYKNLS